MSGTRDEALSDPPDLSVATNSDVYYTGGVYWNSFVEVAEAINARVSGRPDGEWFDRFAERTEGRVFERALILNCGNGSVERRLVTSGLVKSAIGIDILPTLLAEAEADAAAQGLPLTYHQMDVNSVDFPPGPFDLVVNHAAGHHIRYIDRVFGAVCELLPDDGWFVNFDYVGPHRNQYDYDVWQAVGELNDELPDSVRQELRYPHLPTVIVDDPTEAVHSELILETFQRYFTMDDRADVGGALAYPLLFGHQRLLLMPHDQRRRFLARIIEADELWLKGHPDGTLFAYFAGHPRKDVLRQHTLREAWLAEEEVREQAAAENGGEYYPHTAFQETYLAMVDFEIEATHRRTTIEEFRDEIQRRGDEIFVLQGRNEHLEAVIDELRDDLARMTERLRLVEHGFPTAQYRRVMDSPTGRRLRRTRAVAGLRARLSRFI